MPEKIDITPRWADLLPLFVAVLQDGGEDGRAAVSSELRRMAAAADRWNETADQTVKTLRFILADGNSELETQAAYMAADLLKKLEGQL